MRMRPNGELKSFPSSHAGTSFMGAELMRKKLQNNYPALSYTGYGVAAVTALLRMHHNKH